MILVRSQGTRLPSFFTTVSLTCSSIRSYVVNRFVHARHSRRRRIARPPSQVRESITFRLSLSASQKGQRIRRESNDFITQTQKQRHAFVPRPLDRVWKPRPLPRCRNWKLIDSPLTPSLRSLQFPS